MKWKIRDIKMWEHSGRSGKKVTTYFFREWNGRYWCKQIIMRKATNPNKEFNRINNKKTFKNCRLYHCIRKRGLTELKTREVYPILSKSNLHCQDCGKTIRQSERPFFFASSDSGFVVIFEGSSYYLKFLCERCNKERRQIEKLRE